jgi:hypothetical protein
MKVPISSDQTTSARTDEERTNRGKANFKTGALNHSATFPALRNQKLPGYPNRTETEQR